MPEVLDQALYSKVKKEADEKFVARTGIYKSSWIVREYKKRGGRYAGKADADEDRDRGLLRWFREKWVDLNRPTHNKNDKDNIGYEPCGRPSSSKSKYPLCRPTKRITNDTPKTVSQLSKAAIERAKRSRQRAPSRP